MPTVAHLIGKAVAAGAIEGATDTVPSLLAPIEGVGLEKMIVDSMRKVSTAVSAPAQHPFFLALLAVLTTPLVLNDFGRILNEKTLIRPLREKVRPETLQAVDVINAWRRGSITPDFRNDRLGQLGFPQEDQEALIRLTETLAGAQDIIRFAVREVYNPAQRAALDLDAEIEPVLDSAKEDLRAVGMSDDTFRNFWAAHWALPSVSQAFEMLHREVIDDAELRSILKALDIAPIWRGRLEKIAFTPFTRVDIRRMHKVGVLDDKQVLQAYKAIGYDDKMAAQQVEFVKAINSNPTLEDETYSDREALRARDLTVSDIIGAFEDQLVERADVAQALSGLGYSDGEVEALISRSEFKSLISDTKKAVKNLQSGFVTGALSEVKVRGFMGEMDLPASFIDGKLKAWNLEVESNVSLPTKAEILRWFKKTLISEDEAHDALALMGFADKWVKLMLLDKAAIPEVSNE